MIGAGRCGRTFGSRAKPAVENGIAVKTGSNSGVFIGGLMNAKEATFEYLDKLEDGEEFSGLSLADHIRTVTRAYHYPATTLRYVRHYRAVRGRLTVCVNKAKSVYRVG